MMPALAVYFGLILARVGTFVAIMPLFADRTPRTIRATLALVLAVFYFAAVTPIWDPEMAKRAADVHWLVYALAIIREGLIGASLAFAFGLFLMPVHIAGEFITTQIGLALTPQTGLATNQPAGSITVIFEALASVIFLELNGHHIVLAALHVSFDKFPLGGTLVPHPIGPMLDGLSNAHQMGLLLAGPLSLCLFLLAVVLAIMARTAPQLNIYSVGFTLQVLVALFGLIFLMPDMIRLIVAIFCKNAALIDRFME